MYTTKEQAQAAWERNELLEGAPLEDVLKYRVRNDLLPIQFNGHFRQGLKPVRLSETSFGKERACAHAWIYDALVGVEWVIGRLCGRAGTAEVEQDWLTFTETTPEHLSYSTCDECGKRVQVLFNGVQFEFKTRPSKETSIGQGVTPVCSEAGGMKDYTVQVQVRSGWLYLANNFRGLVPECDKGRYVNYASEIRNTVQDYAKGNVLHFFVGNSCPGVYLNEGDIIVGNPGYTDNDEPLQDFGTHMGSICTDLWWVSAMDAHDFWNKMRKFAIRSKVNGRPLVDWGKYGRDWIELALKVQPGTYEMTVKGTPSVGDYRNGEHFCTIKGIQG